MSVTTGCLHPSAQLPAAHTAHSITDKPWQSCVSLGHSVKHPILDDQWHQSLLLCHRWLTLYQSSGQVRLVHINKAAAWRGEMQTSKYNVAQSPIGLNTHTPLTQFLPHPSSVYACAWLSKCLEQVHNMNTVMAWTNTQYEHCNGSCDPHLLLHSFTHTHAHHKKSDIFKQNHGILPVWTMSARTLSKARYRAWQTVNMEIHPPKHLSSLKERTCRAVLTKHRIVLTSLISLPCYSPCVPCVCRQCTVLTALHEPVPDLCTRQEGRPPPLLPCPHLGWKQQTHTRFCPVYLACVCKTYNYFS